MKFNPVLFLVFSALAQSAILNARDGEVSIPQGETPESSNSTATSNSSTSEKPTSSEKPSTSSESSTSSKDPTTSTKPTSSEKPTTSENPSPTDKPTTKQDPNTKKPNTDETVIISLATTVIGGKTSTYTSLSTSKIQKTVVSQSGSILSHPINFSCMILAIISYHYLI